MKKNRIFVLNWKINLLPNQEEDLCLKLLKDWPENETLIICPSLLNVCNLSNIIEKNNHRRHISTCSQDCCEHDFGNFTGQVSAKSLSESGCKYCLVGHYETRIANSLNEYQVAGKAQAALKNGLIPIICIGAESHKKPEQIKAQAIVYLDLLKEFVDGQIIFAYEPSFAIGSNHSASVESISNMTAGIRSISKPYSNKVRILYGGSINSQNISQISKIESIDGFLIGNASLNFQEIKKMLESL